MSFINLFQIFFSSTIRWWNSLDPNFKSIQTTSKLKQTLRANLFKVSNYYLLGSTKCNIIHTRLKHQCSSLGADLCRANIINDPSCACACPLEDAIHYLLECPFIRMQECNYLWVLHRIQLSQLKTYYLALIM